MSHNREIIIDAIGPLFADPGIREGLEAHDCARVDAILRKESHTDLDAWRLLRALEESLMHRGLMHRGEDHEDGGVNA